MEKPSAENDRVKIIANELQIAHPMLDPFIATTLAETYIKRPETIERLAKGDAQLILDELPDNLKVPDRSNPEIKMSVE